MKKTIVIITILAVLGILLIVNIKNTDKTLSDKAIDLAKNYLEHEKIIVNNNKFLYMNELIYDNNEAELFNDCNMASGVLVTKEDNELYYKAILKCANYNSINNQENIINLKGESIVVLNLDEKYQELGYEKSSYTIMKEEQTINDNDAIFISDPYSKGNLSMHKTCTVNTRSDINEFVNKGAVDYFAVISE